MSTEVVSSISTTTLPATNLQDTDPKVVARSTGTGTWTVDFIRPANSTYIINCLSLVSHNLSSNATYAVLRDDSSGFSSTALVASSTFNAWNSTGFAQGTSFQGGSVSAPRTLAWLTTETSPSGLDWTRLSVVDTANPDGYLQAGCLLAGEKLELGAVNFRYGWNYTLEDLSRVQVTPNGTVLADKRPKRRKLSISYSALTEAEAYENVVHQLMRQKGRTDPFVLVLRPNTTEQWHNQTMYCRLASDLSLSNLAVPTPHYGTALTFEELL